MYAKMFFCVFFCEFGNVFQIVGLLQFLFKLPDGFIQLLPAFLINEVDVMDGHELLFGVEEAFDVVALVGNMEQIRTYRIKRQQETQRQRHA